MSDTIVNQITTLIVKGIAKGATAIAQATVRTIDIDHNALDVAINGALPAGANTIGKVDQGAGGASAWKVDGSAVTQPVSGAVTATQGTAAAVGAPWYVRLSDGASAVAAALDSTVTAMSAKLPATLGAKAAALSLSVTQSTEDAAKVPALGQAVAGSSSPVVLPSAQDVASLAVSAPDATLPASAAQIGGVASTAAPSAVTSGRGVRAWFSLVGAQMVGLLGANGSAIASIINGVPVSFSVMTSTVGATIPIAGVAIKAGPGILGFGWIKNSTGGTVYWQIHNTLSTPAAGAVPHEGSSSSVTTGTTAKLYPGNGMPGLHCDVGIWLVLSTTQYTYTAVASATSTYDLSYY